MKKFIYFALAVSASLILASCRDGSQPEMPGYNVIEANYSSLTKGQETGEAVVTVPVSASSDAGTLNLDFYSNIPFLSPGAYTVGEGLSHFNGHFKSNTVEGDINNGMLTVTLDGVKNFAISGTVRLKDEEGTIVKIRAKGELEYDIPTNYYYTEEAGSSNGIPALVYKLYDKATSVQIAQLAVVGTGEGDYQISPTGEAGTAVFGSVNDGCWFFDASYGTYLMIHGGVSVSSTFPDRLDFSFTDQFNFTENASVDFNYCEKKQDIVPAAPASSGDMSFMMLHFYSIPSPVADGMYELTIKMNYTAGDEFLSFTGLTDTPNPILESLQKDGDSTGGVAFMPVSYTDYLSGAASPKSAIIPTCYYVWEGVKYDIPFDEGFAMVLNAQRAQGVVVGLVAPTNMSYSLPEPLLSGMAAKGLSIWNLMGYYF
ncbi:MAG: hypothetical protein K6C31_07145 [Bacteroidales bacterium]|nr:hypothetical protein [Bacteroidales bacterium]